MRKVVGLTISLGIILIGFYWTAKNREDIGVKTIKAERGPVYATVRATGRVISTREVRLGALAAGQIVSVRIREGQHVAKGEVLVCLDDREASARLSNAKAALHEARVIVKQITNLKQGLQQVWQVGGTSLQEVQDAETQLEIAVADERRAAAELKLAKVMQDKLKITAPFAGLITKSSAQVGEWAVPGTTLITLAEAKAREIEVRVDGADAGLLAVGQRVGVSSDAFPGRAWIERVVSVDPAVQKEGTANMITVHVSCGPDSPELHLGQQIDAKVRVASRENAVKLPFEALINEGGQTYAAILNKGVIHLAPIVTGIEDETHAEIVQGVQPGQEVILPEGRTLKEGQHVYVEGKQTP